MLNGAHSHADCLSFELFGHGKAMLIDPGTYIYNGQPQWRNYFRGTLAHNTVAVDAQPQVPFGDTFKWNGKLSARMLDYVSAKAFGLVAGTHGGYLRLHDPVRHTRLLLFVRPSYWVCIDKLDGEDVHQIEWLFHFPPDSIVERQALGFWTEIEKGIGIYILPTGSRWNSKVHTGELQPIQGWTSLDYGQKRPAPVLVLSETTRLPILRACVLVPSANCSGLQASIALDSAGDTSDRIEFELSGINPNLTDHIVYAPVNQSIQVGDWTANAELAVFRRSRPGEVQRVFLFKTFSLKNGRTVLFDSTEKLDWLSLEFAKPSILVEGDPRVRLKIPSVRVDSFPITENSRG
jgi:hypothetical protein